MAKGEAAQLLLEDKEAELDRMDHMLEKAEKRAEKAEERIEQQRTAAEKEIAELKAQLEAEINKSWWDKLRGK